MRKFRVIKVGLVVLIWILIFRLYDKPNGNRPKTQEESVFSSRQSKYRELARLSRLLAGLSLPDIWENEALVARAENLCATDNFGLSAINEHIGNPEAAIELCLQDNEYFCAYQVAIKYVGLLPKREEYDPVWLLRQFLDATDNTMSWYTVAEEFEKLGLSDEAEKIYEEIYPDLGSDVLLDFYARQGRDEEAVNLIHQDGVNIRGLGRFGRLHEWGLYDEYLAACQENPSDRCLSYLDDVDITKEFLQKMWELAEQFESHFDLKLYYKVKIANTARRIGLATNYYEEMKEDIVEALDMNSNFGAWPIEDRALYQEILSLAEENGAASADLARFAEINEDYDKAYEWYRQSDVSWMFEGAGVAERNGDFGKAEELYSLYLQKMDSEQATLNDLTKIAHAQNMTHNWDEAMRACEQVVSDWWRCDCAAEVIEHLYFHINGDALLVRNMYLEWNKYYYEE